MSNSTSTSPMRISPTNGWLAVGLQQALAAEHVGDAGRLFHVGLAGDRRGHVAAHDRGIEQAVGVVKGWAQHLPAGQVLEGRRDAPFDQHGASVDRLGIAEARQRGAIGADQEYGLDQVAAGL